MVPADYVALGMRELSELLQRYVDWMEDLKRTGYYVMSFKLGTEGGRMRTPQEHAARSLRRALRRGQGRVRGRPP